MGFPICIISWRRKKTENEGLERRKIHWVNEGRLNNGWQHKNQIKWGCSKKMRKILRSFLYFSIKMKWLHVYWWFSVKLKWIEMFCRKIYIIFFCSLVCEKGMFGIFSEIFIYIFCLIFFPRCCYCWCCCCYVKIFLQGFHGQEEITEQ